MKRFLLRVHSWSLLPSLLAIAPTVLAQDAAEAAAAPDVAEPTEVEMQGQPTTTTQTQNVVNWGLPQAGFDPNAHLGSSSRAKADINEGDSFDLGQSSGRVQTLRGNADAAGVFNSSSSNPGMYTVKSGDTLSKIAEQTFGQRLMWPKLWSLNPQIQNPHWIYPGDQVMLSASASSNPAKQSRILGSGAPTQRPQLIHNQTLFLRRLAYIDDPREGVMGEVVGAREGVQMISQQQHVYLELRSDATLHEGQDLTIFSAVRNPPKVRGARRPPGQIVHILGTARVEYWNPKTHVARARVTEAVDVIERGAKVGQVGREHVVVAPSPAAKNVSARVLTSLYPNEFMGQHDVLFIDRGTEDGLSEGNRLFVIRRGDTWRRTLSTTSEEASNSINIQSDENVDVSHTPLHGNEQDFPEEIVGELRVVKAHRFSSLVAVIQSKVELEPGDRAVARVGF